MGAFKRRRRSKGLPSMFDQINAAAACQWAASRQMLQNAIDSSNMEKQCQDEYIPFYSSLCVACLVGGSSSG